jgi:hypothetical protein
MQFIVTAAETFAWLLLPPLKIKRREGQIPVKMQNVSVSFTFVHSVHSLSPSPFYLFLSPFSLSLDKSGWINFSNVQNLDPPFWK